MDPTPTPHPLVWTSERIQRHFAFIRRSWPRDWPVEEDAHWRETARWIATQVPLRGSTVLDYGCGEGRGGHRLAMDYACTVYGIDVEQATWSLDPLQGCVCSEVLEHLEDGPLAQAVRLISQAVKPGGWLVVTTPHAEDLAPLERCCPACGAIFTLNQHVRSWTIPQMRALWEAAGWRTAVCVATDLWGPPPWYRALRTLARHVSRQTPIPMTRLLYVGWKASG